MGEQGDYSATQALRLVQFRYSTSRSSAKSAIPESADRGYLTLRTDQEHLPRTPI